MKVNPILWKKKNESINRKYLKTLDLQKIRKECKNKRNEDKIKLFVENFLFLKNHLSSKA